MKQHLIKDRKKGRGVSASGRRKIDAFIRAVELAGRRKWSSGFNWKGWAAR